MLLINITKSSLLIPLLWVVLLAGCRSTTVVHIDPYLSFHDELFPEYQQVDIESETEVFEIDQAAKTFVDQKLQRIVDPVKRIKALAEGIFNHADLNLLYKNDANTVANDTFNNRAANCLSLTIMTYALAKYAGMGVSFQQVNTPDLWVRREGSSLLNRHINLRLYANTKNNVILYNSKSYQLDFDRRSQSFHLPIKVVDLQRVLAMFYNNKGAEALIKENYTEAYAYFRSALTTDSLLVEASTNLGILYRRSGRLDYAESTYQQALAIDHDDTTTWENLAYIYNITDRKEQANSINSRIQKQRKYNPFYHFMLGEIEYEKQAWQKAINLFKTAIDLDSNQHQFYFAVAKGYAKLGEIQRSQHFLKLAKKHSRDDNDELLYQSKLDSLN